MQDGKIKQHSNNNDTDLQEREGGGGTELRVCVATVLKGEEYFADEWLVYHHTVIDIDHFMVCDDGGGKEGQHSHSTSAHPTRLKNFLAPHIKAGYVTLVEWSYNFNHDNSSANTKHFKCLEKITSIMQQGNPITMIRIYI